MYLEAKFLRKNRTDEDEGRQGKPASESPQLYFWTRKSHF